MGQVDYRIEQEVFQGPFDVLLKAINEGQIDVFHISISKIVDSYFSYWRNDLQDLLHASDFLIMAAYLLELKSKLLLPTKEAILEEDMLGNIEESLISHIQEYEVYKNLALTLRERKEMFEKVYGRHEGEKQEKEIELVDVSLQDLVVAFKRAYDQAAKRLKIQSIEEEEITLETRIEEIRRIVTQSPAGVPFLDIFVRRTRLEIVVTFLAILELAKQHFLRVAQKGRFGSIFIMMRKEGDDEHRDRSQLDQDQNNS